MKTNFRTFAGAFGVLLLAVLCVPVSRAQCGAYQKAAFHSSWYGQSALLYRAALINDDHHREPSIVGFWHFKMSIGVNVIDGGTQQWHSDGTVQRAQSSSAQTKVGRSERASGADAGQWSGKDRECIRGAPLGAAAAASQLTMG